jgi:hypothetical protein
VRQKVPSIPGTNRRFRSCEQIGDAAMMRRNICQRGFVMRSSKNGLMVASDFDRS